MMQLKRVLFIAMAALALGVAQAHEGHDDEDKPITQQQAATLADKALGTLQKSKKVDASWSVKQRQETKSQAVSGGKVWRVSYKQPALASAGEQTLYVFIDALGNYVDSNHTGKLAEAK